MSRAASDADTHLVVQATVANDIYQGLKTPFCVPTDDLLQAKDDLLSEEDKVCPPSLSKRPTKLATKQALIFTVITYKSIRML